MPEPRRAKIAGGHRRNPRRQPARRNRSPALPPAATVAPEQIPDRDTAASSPVLLAGPAGRVRVPGGSCREARAPLRWSGRAGGADFGGRHPFLAVVEVDGVLG
jgi:hypothetical protein